jgi:hypothetical protein
MNSPYNLTGCDVFPKQPRGIAYWFLYVVFPKCIKCMRNLAPVHLDI